LFAVLALLGSRALFRKVVHYSVTISAGA
jgi:hypothetical protein